MEKKIVFITGASSGIGAGCARVFAKDGFRLILNGRDKERLQAMKSEALELGAPDVWLMPFDVRDRNAALQAFSELPEDWKSIDILINNAGLALGLERVYEGDLNDWDTMIDTNIKALLFISRIVVPGMVERRTGHIINIGSTAGEAAYAGGAVYCASKAAVSILSDGLRIDLVDSPVRVTTIKPGLVDTGFSTTRFHGDRKRADKVYDGIEPLSGDDIAGVVHYAASVPNNIQIAEIMVMPTHQASGSVVYKKV